MGFLEAVLAVIGLVALIGVVVLWHLLRTNAQPLEEDLAAPYREGLHAAVRIQGYAQELEQQIYAEALRHAEGDKAQP
jgi:hypothetical protein